jgi:hypothetical protein
MSGRKWGGKKYPMKFGIRGMVYVGQIHKSWRAVLLPGASPCIEPRRVLTDLFSCVQMATGELVFVRGDIAGGFRASQLSHYCGDQVEFPTGARVYMSDRVDLEQSSERSSGQTALRNPGSPRTFQV